MKYISLTKGKHPTVDGKDYEWLSQWKWYASNIKGYFIVTRNSRKPNGRGIPQCKEERRLIRQSEIQCPLYDPLSE